MYCHKIIIVFTILSLKYSVNRGNEHIIEYKIKFVIFNLLGFWVNIIYNIN